MRPVIGALSSISHHGTYLLLGQDADDAQQAFSAAKTPTLHNALPTIEIPHAAWTKAAAKRKYHAFTESLEAATDKLDENYQKTAASDAHIMTMGMFWINQHIQY